MGKRRPKAPKRRRNLHCIRPIWTGSWRWRAVIEVGGKTLTGPTRETQEAAFADVPDLRARHAAPRSFEPEKTSPGGVTLRQAFDAVIEECQLERQLSPFTMRNHRDHAKRWCDALGAHLPVSTLTASAINQVVAAWMAEPGRRGSSKKTQAKKPQPPRKPNTVRQKDMPHLKRAFAKAAVAWPDGVHVPSYQRPEMSYFPPGHVATLIERMRTEEFDTACRSREYHADLVQLIASTGMRYTEVARLQIEDIDLARRRIRKVNAKDAGQIDLVPIIPSLEPVLERLIKRAKKQKRRLVPNNTYLTTMFARWQDRLDEPRLNGRTLRHTVATTILALGGQQSQVQAVLCHRRASTSDRYVHEVASAKHDGVSFLEQDLAAQEDRGGVHEP